MRWLGGRWEIPGWSEGPSMLVVDLPVGLVDVINSENGQTVVISQIAEGDSSPGLDAQLINLLLVHIERDGHAEEVAIGQAVLLNDAICYMSVYLMSILKGTVMMILGGLPFKVLLCHETCVAIVVSSP